MHTSAEASACPLTRQRTWSSSPACCSMESTVRAFPAPRVRLPKFILEWLVKVNGREDSRPTGLRVSISLTELYGICSGTSLNNPEKQLCVNEPCYHNTLVDIRFLLTCVVDW